MAKKLAHKIFNSKLLLFGEHIINKGAMGIAMPLENYNGMLRMGDIKDTRVDHSNTNLELIANHIIYHDVLSHQYDTNQLLEDIEKGLYFDSNIPQGYGLGSSGALVAALYYQYSKFRKKNFVLSELKNELALLESYYHGKSSGLDALVCYLDKTVVINNGEVSEAFKMPESDKNSYRIFLLNTHITRSTSPFVNLFLEKYKDKKFAEAIQKSLVPTTNLAIAGFLKKNYTALWQSVKIISQLQYDLLPEFIPNSFKEIWQTGLRTNEFHLKICGAGGGGFIIGFAKADSNLESLLRGQDVAEIMQF